MPKKNEISLKELYNKAKKLYKEKKIYKNTLNFAEKLWIGGNKLGSMGREVFHNFLVKAEKGNERTQVSAGKMKQLNRMMKRDEFQTYIGRALRGYAGNFMVYNEYKDGGKLKPLPEFVQIKNVWQ